jgi:hypothetical protein
MVDSSRSNFTDTMIAFVMDTAWNLRARTMFRPRFVNERAIYRWQIGSDPRIYETSHLTPPQGFFREFEGAIEVTLEIEQPDTEGCLTDEEAIKSFTKTVHFKDVVGSEYPILGTYQGQFTDENETLIEDNVELSVELDGSGYLFNLVLQGIVLPGEICTAVNENGIKLYGSLYQSTSAIKSRYGDCFRDIRPIILFDLDRETATQLTVDVWYDDPDTGQRLYKQFRGERV